MIGHRTRFRENDDLPLRRGPVVKKKPLFSNARALITRNSMRSRDAQCNTGGDLKVIPHICTAHPFCAQFMASFSALWCTRTLKTLWICLDIEL